MKIDAGETGLLESVERGEYSSCQRGQSSRQEESFHRFTDQGPRRNVMPTARQPSCSLSSHRKRVRYRTVTSMRIQG